MTTILKFGLLIYLGAVIVYAFIKPPPMSGQVWSEGSRIFYFHVPQAFVSFVAFAVSMIYSILYLKRRDPLDDRKAALSVELGLVFCVLATLTGSVFAKIAWGSYWNWDPRQTSILILMLIYAAYFALRQAVTDERRRASFSAVYLILAFVAVPVFGFILPRVYESLHPSDTIVAEGQIDIRGYVAAIFFSSLACFLAIYYWLFNLGGRVISLEHKHLEELDAG